MRPFSKLLLRAARCGLFAFSIFLTSAYAKDKAKDLPLVTEQDAKLDPYEVKTNPFAHWGIGIHGKLSVWSRVSGGPPKALLVSGVGFGSPADVAGVQLGDEIMAVNGVATTRLDWSELVERYSTTESGDVIKLELFDHATKQRRNVEFQIRAKRIWERKDPALDSDCWGIRFIWMFPNPVRGVFFPEQKRILRWEAVEVFNPHKPKKSQTKTVQKPVYIYRRAAVFSWPDMSLTLIERENHVVEVIEVAKVPESDTIVGRLVHKGATLLLKPDGTYELNDAPLETEPVKSPPVSCPVLPAAPQPAIAPQTGTPGAAP